MNACEYSAMITGLACAIAKGKDCDEVSLLAALFTQLGDTLATIAVYDDVCCQNNKNNGGIEQVI